NGVAVKGGYAGIGAQDPNARDIVAYPTILSGDLLGNDGNPPNFSNYTDNSYNVVLGNFVDKTAMIEGFTVEHGYGTYGCIRTSYVHSWTVGGGGMRNEFGSPTVKNCTFRYNKAERYGGAIVNIAASPEITDCTFIGNIADKTVGTGGSGGAIWNCDLYYYSLYPEMYCTPKIKNCTFIDNYASVWGGAVYSEWFSECEITDCMFVNNHSSYGGAIANSGAIMTVTSCVLAGNNSGLDGGGLCNWDASIVIKNSTFYNNHAGYRGGGVFHMGESPTTLTNCIIWDNTDNYSGNDEVFILNRNDSVNITYCNIKISCGGTGNISTDPLFVDVSNPLDNGLRLAANSPCIDRANDCKAPYTDILGRFRVDIPGIGSSIVDIGAYEYRVWYVDDNAPATPTPNGKSWNTAFNYLQDALAVAKDGDEICVAQGIYKPTQGSDRNATFRLKNSVSIRGGYAGYGTPNPDAYDIANYPTILSGDLLGNDGNPPNFNNYGDNSYNVVTCKNINSTTILEGFIIRGGNADNPAQQHYPYSWGGGMVVESASPTVKNCIFDSNRAYEWGGAVFIGASGKSPKFINCIFYNNRADGLVKSYYLRNRYVMIPMGSGGAVNILYGSPEFTNCVFAGNYANNGGGAITHAYDKAKIINCTFSENYSYYDGNGKGEHIYSYFSNGKITNSILWNDHFTDGEAIHTETCPNGPLPTITYCDVKDGYTGEGNINSDPLFVQVYFYDEIHHHEVFNPMGDDGIFFTDDDGLQLGVGNPHNPCVNTANDDVAPSTDILGTERSGICQTADMGAYEYTP
ncbi:MAG: right-handed parallel beta-helix repeat-containing protein, partial [Candidatus Ratteibacteria bacterium]|nr:right-handed parallel beta-helix repeat-containing protein [Candidatus Ratteibacteria bacterium]